MNKINFLIIPEQQVSYQEEEVGKKPSSAMKKFNSERNLFFNKLLNGASANSLNNHQDTINPGKNSIENLAEEDVIIRTPVASSDFKKTSQRFASLFSVRTLLKRSKSSKEISKSTSFMNKDKNNENSLFFESSSFPSSTHIQGIPGKTSDKISCNSIAVECSNQRKSVKELRKSFENYPENRSNNNINTRNNKDFVVGEKKTSKNALFPQKNSSNIQENLISNKKPPSGFINSKNNINGSGNINNSNIDNNSNNRKRSQSIQLENNTKFNNNCKKIGIFENSSSSSAVTAAAAASTFEERENVYPSRRNSFYLHNSNYLSSIKTRHGKNEATLSSSTNNNNNNNNNNINNKPKQQLAEIFQQKISTSFPSKIDYSKSSKINNDVTLSLTGNNVTNNNSKNNNNNNYSNPQQQYHNYNKDIKIIDKFHNEKDSITKPPQKGQQRKHGNDNKSNIDSLFLSREYSLSKEEETQRNDNNRRSLNEVITNELNQNFYDPNNYNYLMENNAGKIGGNITGSSNSSSKSGIRKSNSVNRIDFVELQYGPPSMDFVGNLTPFMNRIWQTKMNLGYGFRSQRNLRGNWKELDLEQKIDLEIKMREGSAKLLAACNNSKNSSSGGGILTGSGNVKSTSYNVQMLEAAKNLLTSNERMTAYMAELQRRKKDRDTVTVKAKPHGKVSLSEIRMPLMWRDTDHFKNKGDHRRFAVFCLAKIGTEIYETSLLCPVDRNLTDVCFSDAILFTNVTPDFELKLEVYAIMMESDLSIASTPRKIKNTIHSSISRTVGRRLAANLKDELNNTKIGPKFEMIATARLTLSEASDAAHTHDLCLTPNNLLMNTSNKLPLFGHFCCRLAVQPDCYEQALLTGTLCMLQKSPIRPLEGYARLQAFRIDLWDDEKTFQSNCKPRRCVEINRNTKIQIKSETDLVIINLEEGVLEEHVFCTKSEKDTQKWYSSIRKTIKEHSQWGHVVLSNEPMQLAIPGNSKTYFLRNNRQGSLYDQVPIMGIESTDDRQISTATTGSSRPSVQDIFTMSSPDETPLALNEFRSRAYSSGHSSSHSSSALSASSLGSVNSRKSRWHFGEK